MEHSPVANYFVQGADAFPIPMTAPRCDLCPSAPCKSGKPIAVGGCPSSVSSRTREEMVQRYSEPDTNAIMQAAAATERSAFAEVRGVMTPVRPRIWEVMAFADRMGWKRIGVAFCLAVRDEASKLVKLLESEGYEVSSVICRNFAITKGEVGIPECNCMSSTGEPVCNPIFQAELLNDAGTQMNVVLGLCVGHDMLFNKHSNAYCTTLLVKDRMTGNCPIGPLTSPMFAKVIRSERK